MCLLVKQQATANWARQVIPLLTIRALLNGKGGFRGQPVLDSSPKNQGLELSLTPAKKLMDFDRVKKF